ncbi:patatin-like phospholipase family protein [Metallibacterium sp.]|uniref:patatin-like phospholipase family protein n=1 Tax=Metallibacterium sp. TaxID=2940281 RepID=UPI002621B54F|nr:patatin-like phospholipase family protein [Metallibacterium sp.]
MATYRILSFDGGGLRGVVTAVLLQRLQAMRPDLLANVALMAGTSTGGLIALGLRRGLAPAALRDMYLRHGAQIFDASLWQRVRSLGTLAGARYPAGGREQVLRELLGADTRLDQLSGPVLITAFDLDPQAADPAQATWKPKLFHNLPGSDSDGVMLAWQVGMATSAAPTYFSSFDGYVDGGVYANNPAMCALAQTQDPRTGGPVPWDDIRLLSLGTGIVRSVVPGQTVDWGYLQWAPKLVALLSDGVSGIADYQCRMMLGAGQYRRYAPFLPPGHNVAMDDVDALPWLVEWAGSLPLQPLLDWLEGAWK